MDYTQEGVKCGSTLIKRTVFTTRCSMAAESRPEARSAARNHSVAGRRPTAALPACCRAPAAADGHHLQCLRRLRRHGADFSVRPDPAHRARREWERIERGLKQRIHALNEFIDDIYHDQKILKDKVIPEEIIRSAAVLPPAVPWHQPAAARLVSHHRHRSGAARRRPDLRARGQSAGAVRRFLRAGEPRPDEAHVPAASSKACGSAPWMIIRVSCWRLWRRLRRPARRQADRGAADARHVQLGLLRAQLPGAANGDSTGGRQRPDGAGRARYGCGPPRGCAMWTSSTAASTTTFWIRWRSATDSLLGVPGLMEAYRGGKRGAGQRARQRRGGRQGGLRLCAQDDPLLRRRGSHSAQRPDLPLLAGAGPPARARRTWTSWW